MEALMSSVGGTSASTLGGPNYGAAGGAPEAAQPAQADASTRSSRSCVPNCRAFPGMQVYLQNPPTVRIGGQVTKSLYQFSLLAPDKKELYATPRSWKTKCASCPACEDVTSDMAIAEPAGERHHRPRQGGGACR